MRKTIVYIIIMVFGISAYGQVIDSFYLNLLKEGMLKLENKQYEEAFGDLRIASFGLMNNRRLFIEANMGLVVASYYRRDAEGVERYMGQLERLSWEDYKNEIRPFLLEEFNKYREGSIRRDDRSRRKILEEKNSSSGLSLEETRELVMIYFEEEEYREIHRLLRPIEVALGNMPELYLYWGASQFEQRRFRNARRYLAEYKERTDTQDDLYFWTMARKAVRDKEWDLAHGFLRRIENREKFQGFLELEREIRENVDTGTEEIDEMISQRDYSGIIEYLEGNELLNQSRYYQALITAYFQNKEYEKCIDMIENIDISRMNDAMNGLMNYYLGISYLEMRDMEKACNYLIEANKKRQYLRENQAEFAIKNLVERQCMTYEEIKREYQKNSDDPYNILAMAFADFIHQNYTESIDHLNRIRKENERHLYANYFLGINHYYTGDYERSVFYYEYLIENGHQFSELFFRLGLSQYMNRDFSSAFENLERVRGVYDNNRHFREVYEDLKRRLDQ